MNDNTIYEYYEKVSDRYFIARTFGKKIIYFWQPLAHKIRINGYDEFDFFIYKEGKYFMFCEGLTGAIILRQCDLQSRIMRRCGIKMFRDCLPAELAKMGGRGALNQIIINFLVDYEQVISPGYKSKKI